MYRAALSLWSKGEPVDAITLVNELDERAELDAAGGQARVAECDRCLVGDVLEQRQIALAQRPPGGQPPPVP